MLLYNKLMSNRHVIPKRFLRYLCRATIFNINTVSQYYWQNMKNEWTMGDFPNIAPPYSVYWMEYKIPNTIIVRGEKKNHKTNTQIGVLSMVDDFGAQRNRDDHRWTVYSVAFTSVDDFEPVFIDFGWEIDVDASGHVCSVGGTEQFHIKALPSELAKVNQIIGEYIKEHQEDAYLDKKPTDLLVTYMHPVWLGLSMLHCRNTSVSEVSINKKSFKRKHKDTTDKNIAYKYHVLKVPGLKQALSRGMQQRGNTKGKIALHISAGHMKTYTEEAPLFGKHVGSWFWGDNVRGSSGKGIVNKSYKF